MLLPPSIAALNDRALQTLVRSIRLNPGEFSLIVVRCNYGRLRRMILSHLQETTGLDLRELRMGISQLPLYQAVRSIAANPALRADAAEDAAEIYLAAAPEPASLPQAVMVTGLEAVHDLESLLSGANLVRDEFRKHCPFPLVLWTTDRGFQTLMTSAPDLKNFAASSIAFKFPVGELLYSLRSYVDHLFATLLNEGGDRFLPNSFIDLDPGSRLRTELEFALADIYASGSPIDRELKASIEFLQGRDAQARLEMERARLFYERSLVFWARESDRASTSDRASDRTGESDPSLFPLPATAPLPFSAYRERQACLLFHLGAWWRRYARMQRADYRLANLEAKRYFEQCLEIFQQDHRPELVARFITALGETLRKLEHWQELETIARMGITLHETYTDPSRLARDYGFLAEVALARQPQTAANWTEAKIYAEQAIDILNRLEQAPGRILTQSPKAGEVGQDSQEGSYKTLPKLANQAVYGATADLAEEDSLALEEEAHRGWYLLLLARSLAHLDDRQSAIEALEEGLAIGNPQLDPTLYIQTLAELRSLYFQQARYREAFQAKQHQRILRQQYGFTAFVGASRLEPHQIAGQDELAASVVEAWVTQEIAASGRQQDVNRLVARVSLPKDKLTVIHGASGVGKSSIITVGLIPALRQKRTIEARLLLPVLISVYTDWISSFDRSLSRGLDRLEEEIDFPTYPPAPSPTPSRPDTLLTQLQQATDRNFYPIIIFDQFEEFFFAYQTIQQRRSFYLFLRDCLNLPYVKVILSLREDYLHYLLEVDRIANLEAINHDILSKAIRYPLGDFSPEDARAVILSLTERSQFTLETALVDRLVTDLAGELGGVRPIELQIVGAQLQDEDITTLFQYEQLGTSPKETLVQWSLEDVIEDCGTPNEAIAKAVLFLLTNADATRPLKTHDELVEELTLAEIPHTHDQLELVLEILVGSGLVLKIPEEPAPLHQLVHDYLIPFIRENRDFDLQEKIVEIETEMAIVQKQRDQLAANNRALDHTNQQLARTNQDLSYANQELSRARQQERQVRSRTALASAALLLVALGLSVYLAIDAKEKVNIARRQERTARAQESAAKQATEVAEKRLQSAEARAQANLARSQQRVEAVRQQRQTAQQAVAQAQQELAAAQTELQRVSQGAGQAVRARQLAEAKVQAAETKVAQARSQLDRANADVAAAQAEEEQALMARQEAIQGTKLERSGLAALQQFQFAQLEALVSAVKAGKDLKLLMQGTSASAQQSLNPAFTPSIANPFLTASPLLALQTITDNIHEQVQVGGQQGSLWTAQFSPDGQSWITGSSSGLIQRWTLQGKPIQSFQTDYSRFLEVQISPDGQRLLTRGANNPAFGAVAGKITATLWDLQGNRLATLQTDRSIASLQFRPDGQIATGSEDGTLTLWSAKGDRLQTIQTGQGIRSLHFSPNGQSLATLGDDNSVKLWDAQGKLRATLNPRALINLQFSPTGQQLVTIAADSTIQLWSAQGKLQATIASHMGDITSVHFSPDGTRFATTSTDGTAILWTTAGKQQAVLRGHRGSVLDAQFSPKGQILATLGDDKTVRLWDRQGNPIAVFRGHRGRILSLQFSPDGQQIATSSADGTARLWSLKSNAAIELPAVPKDAYSLQFSPKTHRLAIANPDGSVTLRTPQGQTIVTLPSGGRVRGLQFSPDGQQIAIASDNLPNDTVIRVWDAQGKQIANLVEPLGNLNGDPIALDFSPNGQRLASIRHNTLTLWSLPTRQKVEIPQQTSAQFSPDGQSVAAIGTDGIARLFDLQGKPLRDFRVSNKIGNPAAIGTAAATVLQFSANRPQIAIASVDGVIRLWDLQGNLRQDFRGHPGNVLALQFSPNGQLLASAGVDGTARLWNLQGQQLEEFRGHQGDVLDVQFSPNGDRLATRGDDNTLRLWNLQGQQIAQYEGYPTAISDDWQTIATGGSQVHLWQISSLDGLLAKSCAWLQDYLTYAPALSEGDRGVCSETQ